MAKPKWGPAYRGMGARVHRIICCSYYLLRRVRIECDLIVQKLEICVGQSCRVGDQQSNVLVLNFRFWDRCSACLGKFASYLSYHNAH